MTDDPKIQGPTDQGPAPAQATSAAEAAAAPRSKTRRNAMIAGGVVVVAVALWLVTLLPGWLGRPPEAQTTGTSQAADSGRRIQTMLFYVSDDGAALVPMSREVPYGATPAEQARHIVSVQIQAAPAGKVSPIPPSTRVRAVFVGAQGELYVDLTSEISVAHFGGTLDEALAVYAIVNAVTTNMPDVKAVQILVEGKEVDTLAGHIDLREPITRSNAWVRKGQ